MVAKQPPVRLTLAALVLLTVQAVADPSTADVDRARAAHAKELDRLKAELLAAIDARMRENQKAGRGKDYLLPERKGFAEKGITPLLPEMQPAVRAYLDGKKKADEQLASTLDRAGEPDEARRVRGESAPSPAPAPKRPAVESTGDLSRFLAGTVWSWLANEEMHLKADGRVAHTHWKEAIRWQAIDRRTVILVIDRDRDRLAVLRLSEDLASYTGYGWEGAPITQPRPRKR